MFAELFTSDKPNKKYFIQIGKKKIYFGDPNYEDYTQHHDKERRRLYRERHKHDNLNDPYSPGFWSWHLLWGDSTSVVTNFKRVDLSSRT